MPTPLPAVLSAIAEVWTDLVPALRPTRRYKYNGLRRVDPDSASAHRSFWFDYPARGEPLRETDDGVVVPYTITAQVILDSDGYTADEFLDAVIEESSALMRAIDAQPEVTWPAGTATPVITGRVTPTAHAREGSTAFVVAFEFSVEVAET